MKNFFRKATPQEVQFYEEKLYPLQDVVLSLLKNKKDIYLTGGTLLSRFYFNHRLSDDLDIFIKINKKETIEKIQKNKRTDIYAKDLAGLLSRKFTITKEFFDDTYSRFYINTKKISFKIDFVREYNHYGNLILHPQSFYINNLEDIGACKICAFEDRCEIKDIIDLFYLTKKISIKRLFELADLKRVPVAYENLLTINTQGISGMSLITKEIDEKELTDFVELLKVETEKEVKKKEQIAIKEIDKIIAMNLWDFPPEFRNINKHSIPVLKRRLKKMNLPKRNVLENILR